MSFVKTTEQDSNYNHLEQMSISELIRNINNEDKTVPLAVEKELPQIELLIDQVVAKLKGKIRVLRDNVVVYEGELESLRRFKDDVNEVRNGTECGIGVKNYTDVKPGDKIEVFDVREVARKI